MVKRGGYNHRTYHPTILTEDRGTAYALVSLGRASVRLLGKLSIPLALLLLLLGGVFVSTKRFVVLPNMSVGCENRATVIHK